jgi:hypothetical protein
MLDPMRSSIVYGRRLPLAPAALACLLAGALEANTCRPDLIPNGTVNSCSNCHRNRLGGGPRTPFGEDVLPLLRLGRTLCFDDVFWGPALAELDSDGDGRTNGEELQDPLGAWFRGARQPGNRNLVTHPGVADCPKAADSAFWDSRCISIAVEGPEDRFPGTYTVTAAGADDSGDALVYTFSYSLAGSDRPPVSIGPRAQNTAAIELSEPGLWSVSALVDDACAGAGDDARCTVEVEVLEPPPPPPPPPVGPFLRGDANGDAKVDISDAIFDLAFLFGGGAEPPCLAAGDANGDGVIDISDASFSLNFQFQGGSSPPAPYPDCGISADPEDGRQGCGRPLACGS